MTTPVYNEAEAPHTKFRVLNTPGALVAPGILHFFRDLATSDRRLAFGQCLLTFLTWPAALVFDMIDGKIALTTEADGSIVFDWSGPMSPTDEYLYEWKTVTFTVAGNRLEWFKAICEERLIQTRMLELPGRACAHCQVPVEKWADAAKLLHAKIGGIFVRNLADNDPVFEEGGEAWKEEGPDFLS